MSRYRLVPTPAQEATLREHCAHARYVWNLAVEQQSWWRPGRGTAPGYYKQAAQLTEARAAFGWLAGGSQMVQQQALRDFAQAITNYFAGTHGMPTWRKKGRCEGFRVVALKPGRIRRLSRRTGEVWIPKAGWVRFRLSRVVPAAKSCRITCDRAGRWHIAFASIPKPVPGPGTGEVVGVDRGVTVSAALSTGELLKCPGLSQAERSRKRRLIRVEDLRITNMTRSARGTLVQPGRKVRQKAGLNRGILASGWGQLARRLEDKARGRVEKVNPAFTSQRCSGCGHVAVESRQSQAAFRCAACGYSGNADVNAAKNIAAGHAVTARGR